MSALPLKADMLSDSIDVRFVPIADIVAASDSSGACGATTLAREARSSDERRG